jgi:hypothetical protein
MEQEEQSTRIKLILAVCRVGLLKAVDAVEM